MGFGLGKIDQPNIKIHIFFGTTEKIILSDCRSKRVFAQRGPEADRLRRWA